MTHAHPCTLLVVAAAVAASAACARPTRLAYPTARRAGDVDTYHGTRVPDPYRWLEDPDSAETRAWIEAENRLTFDFLTKIPARARVKERLTQLWDFERYGIPFSRGGRYFYTRNDGLQNQAVLYTSDRLDGEPRVLLDPNLLSTDGTVALGSYSVSDDGRLLAYSLQVAGSDWQEWHVRDVETGRDLPDVLKWSKFSGASFTPNARGFYYGRYDEPRPGAALVEANYYHKLYYHVLGTQQADDLLVYERPDEKEWGFGGTVTEDGRYLIITVWKGTDPKNLVFYKDLAGGDGKVVELLDRFEAQYSFAGNDGPVFYFLTDADAPRRRLVAIDTRDPARLAWREIVPQAAETLEDVSLIHDRIIASYLKDAHSRVLLFAMDGQPLGEVALPGIGTASGFGGRRKDTETFFAYSSFATPSTIYRYDLESGATQVVKQPELVFDPSDYVTLQVFYASKDGTRVPMFISRRKDVKLDGKNPTYLYGYGGFGVSLTPWFSVSALAWMEMGGVFAVPNLRGGGEHGEEWHQAGTRARKQNVFDDFIAAAEWLIANRYTSPARLAIGGGSNGGLLVGACLTQRPDLFGAAAPSVGVLDMLRFHKFTIGWAWVSDYGSSDDPDDFRALLAYSPLHNVQSGTKYPPTLITTADHDDRVVPAHSFKFAAALQAAQAGPGEVLIRVDTKAGHGGGKPTAKQIEEHADRWAFLIKVLGMAVPAAK